MKDDADQTRRSITLCRRRGDAVQCAGTVRAQSQGAAPAKAAKSDEEGEVKDEPISPVTIALAEYVSKTLDRELPPAVVAKTKLHVLDTIAAMMSGSRLKAGEFAARYVDTLGGKPQATVIGTRHPDLVGQRRARQRHGGPWRRDRRLPISPAASIPAAASCRRRSRPRSSPGAAATTCCARSRSATTSARGRSIALGFRALYTERHSTHSLATTFGATAAAAAMLRLDPRQVRHAFSFAAQQASGVPYWERDREHVEKAFDFGGMGARNGVTAATMVASGLTGIDDFISGKKNMFTALGDQDAAAEKLIAELGTRFEIIEPRSRNGASARRCNRCSMR